MRNVIEHLRLKCHGILADSFCHRIRTAYGVDHLRVYFNYIFFCDHVLTNNCISMSCQCNRVVQIVGRQQCFVFQFDIRKKKTS